MHAHAPLAIVVLVLLAGCAAPAAEREPVEPGAEPAGHALRYEGVGAAAFVLQPNASSVEFRLQTHARHTDLTFQFFTSDNRTGWFTFYETQQGLWIRSASGSVGLPPEEEGSSSEDSSAIELELESSWFGEGPFMFLAGGAGSEPVAWTLWINGTEAPSFGPGWGAMARVEPEVFLAAELAEGPGAAVVRERSFDWQATRGLVAQYRPYDVSPLPPPHAESVRLAGPDGTWASTRFSAPELQVNPVAELPTHGFLLRGSPGSWSLDIETRAGLFRPLDALVVADVELPPGFGPALH